MKRRCYGSLSLPGTILTAAGTEPLVGRLVANTGFLQALFRYASFDQYTFFTGEQGDLAAVEECALGSGLLSPERVRVGHLLDLPQAFARGEVDLIHHSSHVDGFLDLVALRDRHAQNVLPITAQIHSLSYPRMMGAYLRAQLHAPSACDAIFCSSEAGRAVVERSFGAASVALQAHGITSPAPSCEMPVIPLGVDVDRLAGGDRQRTRAALNIPSAAVVLLTLGRFTEYDKMDLFPLLEVMRNLVQTTASAGRQVRLILAGARQGTKTPEMVNLWARLLGISEQVIVRVDFPEAEKSDLLAAADIFVAPGDNLQETFGISVVEAMAAGLPVVASDFDGYRDTVTADVGHLIATRWACSPQPLAEFGALLYERPLHLLLGQSVEIDLRAMETTLHSLVLDDAGRMALGHRAQIRARRLYDWSVVIRQYEDVWTRLMTSQPDRRPTVRCYPEMDHAAIFASHLSGSARPDRLVVRSELSRLLCGNQNRYIVYPELRRVIRDSVVLAILAEADQPLTMQELGQRARAAQMISGEPLWHTDFTLGWLVKQGLLVSAPE